MKDHENENRESFPSREDVSSDKDKKIVNKPKAAEPKRRRKNGGQIRRLLLFGLAAVFAFSLWQLSEILIGYYTAISSYDDIAAHMGQETAPAPPFAETGESRNEPDREQEKEEDRDREETPADSPSGTRATLADEEGPEKSQEPIRLTVPDFSYLMEINPEVIGWIQIPGTKINYPIVQGTDNEYYLTHTFSGAENSSGAIFLDCDISDGLEDKNPIIYGHNLKSGAMFSRLNRYARREFWDANPYLYITTPQGQQLYQIFSAYQTDAGADIYYYGFGSDEVFQDYLDRIRSYSIYDAGISVTSEDSIVTLSTCANNTDQRFVVHAKRIQN